MRALIVGVAGLLVATAAPSLAVAAPMHDAALIASTSLTAAPSAAGPDWTTVQKSKSKSKSHKSKSHKSKSHKSKSSSESATIRDISSVKRGKTVEILVDVAKTGRTCSLKVKWAGGSADSPDDVEADSSKVCSFSMDVPDESQIVGTATAEVTVKDSHDKKVASDKRDFTVKDR